MMRRALSGLVMVLATGCGGGSSSSSSSNQASLAAYAGVYNASYSGTYAVTSPAGIPGATNTDMGTITMTVLPSGQLQAVWQIPPNPPSGTVDFNMSGDTGTAAATGGMCFVGKLANGDTQTNCCTECSITFSANGFVQPNTGTFTGTTAAGVAYSGTYSGQWTGTKQ
jgi:hypothetical protein